MIESFYNVKLNDSTVESLPNLKLSPAFVRKLMLDIDNHDLLIKELILWIEKLRKKYQNMRA